jgi:hypothetical protein
MTNVEIVKAVLPKLPSTFTTKQAHEQLPYSHSHLTVKQVGEALRSISYVTNRGKGNFQVRGRRVYGNH